MVKLNKTKMAEFFGVSRSTIGDWGRRGAPVEGGDPSLVARWFVRQRPTAHVSGERARLLKAQAETVELELAEKKGSLHKTSECRKAAFDCGRRLRDMILMVPDRVDAILAAENDRGRVNASLKQELTAALMEYATEQKPRHARRDRRRTK
jgi:phage terminase Nu1 subunit (DNA packaging protein)